MIAIPCPVVPLDLKAEGTFLYIFFNAVVNFIFKSDDRTEITKATKMCDEENILKQQKNNNLV